MSSYIYREYFMAFKPMFVRSANNYDMNAASDESAIACHDPSLTVQSQRDEADINVLVKRFGITGVMPQNVRLPEYADFDSVFDFQSAMNAARTAQESFDLMPADVRARFGNSPQAFFEFCTANEDGKLVNIDELRKLGLAIPEKVVVESAPTRVVVVDGDGDGEVGSGKGAGSGSGSSR